MTALTRGPLPARVYWRRRLLIALVVLGLVLGGARLLGFGSGASSEERPQARQVAADQTSDSEDPSAPAVDTPSETRQRGPAQRGAAQRRPAQREGKKTKQDRGPVLAEPEGVCSDRDVAVTPGVRSPVAGSPVTFTLELRTISTPACTWQVSPATLTMRITSGSDDIWTSQDCPRAIPNEEVVVRNNVGTEVEVSWSGRRSDDECSRLTGWALPGWYYVDAAALAGEPSDLHFELEKPEPAVVTKPAKRDRKAGKKQRDSGSGERRDGRRRG